MNTSELKGAALDWAVAKCEGHTDSKDFAWYYDRRNTFNFSTDWAQGGPIIEREGISINSHLDGYEWFARDYWGLNEQAAEKPLVAAMRCYIANKLGDTVEIPDELHAQGAT
jgi:hypothetical protein